MGPLATRALVHASANVGQQENPIGSNWGFPVSKWLGEVGIHFAAEWCMAFVYSMFNEAATDMSITNPLVKTGGCLYAWANAPSNHQTTPEPGDIFIMDFGNGAGHTGIIESIEGSVLTTIEGNSNSDGSRLGWEVVRHQRTIPDAIIVGYLRY